MLYIQEYNYAATALHVRRKNITPVMRKITYDVMQTTAPNTTTKLHVSKNIRINQIPLAPTEIQTHVTAYRLPGVDSVTSAQRRTPTH